MSRPSCCPPGGNDKPQTEALQHAHEQAYARPHSVVPTQTADPLSDSHSEARAGRDDYHGDVHYSAHGHSEPRSHSQPHEDGHDDGDGHDHSGHSHSRTPHQDPFLPGETAAEAHCVDHSCSAPIEELVDEGEGCCTGECSWPLVAIGLGGADGQVMITEGTMIMTTVMVTTTITTMTTITITATTTTATITCTATRLPAALN